MHSPYFIVIFTLYLFFNAQNALAYLYDDGACVMPYEYGNEKETITVTVINPTCSSNCDTNCKQLSRKNAANVELNNIPISNCIRTCQNGKTFTGYYKSSAIDSVKKTETEILEGPVIINSPCIIDSNPYLSSSGFSFKAGDTVKIVLQKSAPSDIYLCGRYTAELIPIFSAVRNSPWQDKIHIQNQWPNNTKHSCLTQMSVSEFNQITNFGLWDPSTAISTAIPNYIGQSCKFSARNPNFTDTGLYIADGDEITMVWSGNFGMDKAGVTTADTQYTLPSAPNSFELVNCMYNFLLKTATYPANQSTRDEAAELCKAEFYKRSAIDFLPPSATNSLFQTNFEYQDTAYKLVGEDFRLLPIAPILPNKIPQQKTWYGLSGLAIDSGLEKVANLGMVGCDPDVTKNTDPQCALVKKYDYPVYIVNGILSGYSTNKVRLGIRHTARHEAQAGNPAHFVERAADKTDWDSNYGGYNVQISVSGCHYSNGERMQYTFAESVKNISNNDWIDVSHDFLTTGRQTFTATKNGHLFFRIHRLLPPENASTEVAALYTDQGNLFGSYTVTIAAENSQEASKFTGFLGTIASIVFTTIFGDSTNYGVLQKLFTSITSGNVNYIQLVRALVVLYVTIFGIGFMVGTIKHSLHEIKTRLFKVIFVLLITSPTSWNLLNMLVVQGLTYGSVEIMSAVMTVGPGTTLEVTSDPAQVFHMFDLPLSHMFSQSTGHKLHGLFLTNIVGAMSTIIIGISIIIYCVAVIKAATMYIFSIVGLGMLLLISPIMIPMILFQATKQIFDAWWKYILSYALQPILVFATIAIANSVYLLIFYTALGFAACPICLWAVDVTPIYHGCWIPGWVLPQAIHGAGVASPLIVPWGAFFGCFMLMLVAHVMYRLPDAMADTAVRIVTGSPINIMSVSAPVAGNQRGQVSIARAGSHLRKRVWSKDGGGTVREIGTAISRTAQRTWSDHKVTKGDGKKEKAAEKNKEDSSTPKEDGNTPQT